MPGTPKQANFFRLVRGVQTGKIKPSKVSSAVRRVARSISAKDAEDFTKSVAELRMKKAVLSVLKELHEPMYLNETEVNPVAKTFNQTAKFDEYINKFSGLPLSPKETEALTNFKGTKGAVEQTPKGPQIKFESTDTFNNSAVTIIKKMKQGVEFVFTAFTKFDQTKPEEPEEAPIDPNAPPEPDEPETPTDEMDDIVVTKSTTFTDDIKGGAILAEFLKKLDL